MKDLHERGAGRKQKKSTRKREDAAQCRGDDPVTQYPLGARRDAHARWVNNDNRLTDSAKQAALMLLMLYPHVNMADCPRAGERLWLLQKYSRNRTQKTCGDRPPCALDRSRTQEGS